MEDGKDMNKTAHIAGNLKTVSLYPRQKRKKRTVFSSDVMYCRAFVYDCVRLEVFSLRHTVLCESLEPNLTP